MCSCGGYSSDTIRAMKVREAKDFLVAQTAEQAALDGVPLTDLEKRMMYFTEGPEAIEDPSTLNEEFEAQYDIAQFEKKISRLMGHAYKRIKSQNPEIVRRWDAAIRALRRGDHYILVLWGHPLKKASLREWFAMAVLVLFLLMPFLVAMLVFPRRDGTWPLQNYVPVPNPRFLQALFALLIIGGFLFPKVLFWPLDRFFDFIDRLVEGKKTEPEH
ncbi:MAG: hypothetical protein AUI12_02620 [Acidobacteria bacterium 13_2_20CM_2_57_6]|nr:MAG: hypothetical protein AUH11_07395 [Acidobacteria bacterium 13_2_20CM_57_17]OLB89291.1 MAG: hypothetical protein AUI12_02620 [Acidobacteria bacterium 13_2_20CM_2_57_6]